MNIFNDKRKYLLILAILVLAGFCFYFNYIFRENENALVREMAWEKQQDVNLLCGIVDKLVEMDERTGNRYGYDKVLKFAVQYIETNFRSTYAQVFDEKLNPLMPLNPGVGGGKKHNPLDYPEFVEAVQNNESGNLIYRYETAEAGKRDIYMTFRWIPTDVGHSQRYLVAVGISKYTITEQIDRKAVYGAVALIIVAAAYIIVCTVLIVRLGYIYDQREGDKWRNRGDPE